MDGGYPIQRIDLYNSFVKRRLPTAQGSPWLLEPRTLRFRHGETVAELKVPYHMGSEDEETVEAAVDSLAALLARRYEGTARPRPEEAAPPSVQAQQLKDRTYRTDTFISESFEKRVAVDILSSTPYIDSALILAWLGPDGPGRRLAKWLTTLLDKAMKEESRHAGEERTAYLALLAAISTADRKRERLKGVRARAFSYDKLDLAVGLATFAVFRNAVAALCDALAASGASYYTPHTGALLQSAVTPMAFISIKSNVLAGSHNPYGLTVDALGAIAALAPELDPDAGLTGEALSSAGACVRGDAAAAEAVREAYETKRFRELSLSFMAGLDLPGSEAQETIHEVYNDDRLIRNLLGDPRSTEALAEALEEIRLKFPNEPMILGVTGAFQEFLSSFKKSVFKGILGSSRRTAPAEAFDAAVAAYSAYRADERAESFVSLMRSYLADRRAEFSNKMLAEEYARGSLYRFSVDDRPFLRTLEIHEEGQLVIDLRNFTRKTLKVREIAMAEFMRERFYMPILNAAARYRVGAGIVKDERGITLTNLPGDAAIFSGGVAHLVSLARDIQKIYANYREQLDRRLPPGKREEVVADVHRRFEARKDELRQRRADLGGAIERSEPGVEAKLMALGEEEHRLENTYREELESAIKGELEAGLFISYGPKAETMVIESVMEFSGPVRVSIGEKINEAARGTFRHPMVGARLEMLLEQERIRRQDKDVKYPFDVYTARILSIRMPHELETAFDKLLATRKMAAAQAMAQVVAQEYFNDLKRIISGEPFSYLRLIASTADVYNKGQAMSADALRAYMRETRGSKRFFKKAVKAEELAPQIIERFFFPEPVLEFWFAVEAGRGGEQIEAFYKSGEVIFKGFETNTPQTIYEILNTEGEFFKLLVRHHLPAWSEEARNAAESDPP